MCTRKPTRRSFTLIELLIVLSIIAVLATITVSAYFRLAISSQQKATLTLLSKLDSEYARATDRIMKDCRTNGIPANVQPTILTMAGGDTSRAMVLYQKFRLKQEFPMTFYEALNPAPLPAKQTYVNKLAKAGITLATVNASETPNPWESAICLAMAFEESRGGVTLDLSTLGPNAVRESPFTTPVITEGTPPNNLTTFTNSYLHAIVDTYGQPIHFYRWATDFYAANPGFNPNAKNDPGDPDGLLSQPAWVTSTNGTWFIDNCHAVGSGMSYVASPLFVSTGSKGPSVPPPPQGPQYVIQLGLESGVNGLDFNSTVDPGNAYRANYIYFFGGYSYNWNGTQNQSWP
jgi:prepilin-type N-terminal cleavage/methylation domain-containing protein